MTDKELGELSDRLAIQELKGLYCWVSDAAIHREKIREIATKLFTEDVWADYGFGPVEGRDALMEYMLNGAGASMEQMWHSIHTPRIALDGDIAEGDWTVIVRMIPKGQSESGQIYGRYHTSFRRGADGWQISRVQWGQEKTEL
jgi:SnoaL-like domain